MPRVSAFAVVALGAVPMACAVPPPGGARATAEPGDVELTLGGLASTPDFEHGDLGATFSLGRHLGDDTAVVLRHTATWADRGEDTSLGLARVDFDWRLAGARFEPFVGPSLGVAYGESINETLTLGLHGGARWFVQPRAFVQVVGSYDRLLTRTEDTTEIHRDELFTWSVAIGLLF
jgi:hypothetical protein